MKFVGVKGRHHILSWAGFNFVPNCKNCPLIFWPQVLVNPHFSITFLLKTFGMDRCKNKRVILHSQILLSHFQKWLGCSWCLWGIRDHGQWRRCVKVSDGSKADSEQGPALWSSSETLVWPPYHAILGSRWGVSRSSTFAWFSLTCWK